jgi:hypothetical protein
MMISEETLTLYYYDDGLSADERRLVETALNEDALLSARYTDLCRQLDRWAETDELTAPAHMQQRWHDSIERAARAEQKAGVAKRKVHFLSFFWGAAISAALAVGVGIGLWFGGAGTPGSVADFQMANLPIVTDQAVPVSFTRSLQVHLQDSQWEIVSLPIEDESLRAQLALQLIEQNRFFVRSATMNHSPEFARVLRAFEPVLTRLASGDITVEEATALREKLAFEMSVMLTKMSRGTSEEAETI